MPKTTSFYLPTTNKAGMTKFLLVIPALFCECKYYSS